MDWHSRSRSQWRGDCNKNFAIYFRKASYGEFSAHRNLMRLPWFPQLSKTVYSFSILDISRSIPVVFFCFVMVVVCGFQASCGRTHKCARKASKRARRKEKNGCKTFDSWEIASWDSDVYVGCVWLLYAGTLRGIICSKVATCGLQQFSFCTEKKNVWLLLNERLRGRISQMNDIFS